MPRLPIVQMLNYASRFNKLSFYADKNKTKSVTSLLATIVTNPEAHIWTILKFKLEEVKAYKSQESILKAML